MQEKIRYIKNFKKVILLCIGSAMKQFGKCLVNEQEIMNNIAEMMMEVYISESLALRTARLESIKEDASIFRDILDVNIYELSHTIRKEATDAVCSLRSDGYSEKLANAVEVLTRVNGINVRDARRRIADKLIADNQYKF